MMDVDLFTIRDSFYFITFPYVLLQAGMSALTIGLFVELAFKKLFKKRFFLYVYEVPLLILFVHFWLCGPPEFTDVVLERIYWASLVSFMGMTFAPIMIEWPTIKMLSSGKRKKPNYLLIAIWMITITIALFMFLFWLLLPLFFR